MSDFRTVERQVLKIIAQARANRKKNSIMQKFINWFTKYNKLWVALLGAIVTTLTVYFPSSQWITLIVTFLTAAGVYAAPNRVE